MRNASIGIIYPSPKDRAVESSAIRINGLVEIIRPLFQSIYIIANQDASRELCTDNNVRFLANVVCPPSHSPLRSIIFGELKAQFQIIRGLTLLPPDTKIVYFTGRISTLLIPVLFAKCKSIKTIVLLESRGSDLIKKVFANHPALVIKISSIIYRIFESIVFHFANKLIVDVPDLLNQQWLNQYGNKVFAKPLALRCIKTDFKLDIDYSQRKRTVGYIGRLSHEKGVVNLTNAISMVLENDSNINFIIGGNGPLYEEVHTKLYKYISIGTVKMLSWIPYAQLPEYLNQMKLLVLPSYYEGLPNIVLESMACGTPVLAPPVGAIPDILLDGDTGFIMPDNSSECIAKYIIKALRHPDGKKIGIKSSLFIEQEFRYNVLSQKYLQLFQSL